MEPTIRAVIALDRNGKGLRPGDEVWYAQLDSQRGRYRIDWDQTKVGFVLTGVGEWDTSRHREWSPAHAEKA